MEIRPGWQAQLSVRRLADGNLIVEKTYGLREDWDDRDARDVLVSISCFREWVHNNGVESVPTSVASPARNAGRYLVRVRQPYLGPHWETLLEEFSKAGHWSSCESIFCRLLDVASRLAWRPDGGRLRAEVKPRDFCGDPDRVPILVDTFPPVLAWRHRRLVPADWASREECVVVRERDEVLDVTGSALGIFRNLCEHVMAAMPLDWPCVETAVAYVSRLDGSLGRQLARRLSGDESTNKVRLLRQRRGPTQPK